MPGLKPMSAKLIAVGFGAALIIVGTTVFNEAVLGWVVPFLLLVGALILATEVGIKKFTNLSKMKNLSAMNWLSMVLVVLTLLFAILSVPLIPWAVPAWLSGMSAILIILLGGMIAIEGIFI